MFKHGGQCFELVLFNELPPPEARQPGINWDMHCAAGTLALLKAVLNSNLGDKLTPTYVAGLRVENLEKVLERLATSEKTTIVIARELDGKMRVTSGSWEGEKVFLKDQVLEVHNARMASAQEQNCDGLSVKVLGGTARSFANETAHRITKGSL